MKKLKFIKDICQGMSAIGFEKATEHGSRIFKQSVRDKEFVLGGLLFTGFHFATREQTLNPLLNNMGLSDAKSSIVAGTARKYIGGAVLGLGAYASMKANGKTLADNGVSVKGLGKSALLTVALTPIFTTIVAQNMKQPVMWQYYPEIRTDNFSKPFAVLSSSAWLAYLTGFEFFFRGYLLNHWQQKYSTVDSLAMTTSLYTLVHLPNNWREMLACLPMGYIFGGMSLASQNMASPYLMHWIIASTSDIMSAKYNPDVKFLNESIT